MELRLENIGKRFGNQWIFRRVTQVFESGHVYGITGDNGSGKSTLLKVLAGQSTPNEGEISWSRDGEQLTAEQVGLITGYSSPYIELPQDLTLSELVTFHGTMKGFVNDLETDQIITIMGLSAHKDKQYDTFSSGMQQRVKLAFAMLSKGNMIMLDEPHANLDQQGRQWVSDLLAEYQDGRTVFICSNFDPDELSACDKQLDIRDYKGKNKNHL